MRSRACRALIGLAIVLAPSLAQATAKSLTLLGVSGVGGAHFAELLEQDLADLYDVVPGEVYRRTAELLDKRGASPEEVRDVSKRLRIDALIAGAISGAGQKRVLVLVIREGATGRVVARGRYDLGGRTLPLIRERAESDLVRALEKVRPQSSVAVAQGDSAPPPTDEPVPAEGEPELATTVVRKGPAAEKVTGISAGVGISLMTRRLSFDVASATGYAGGTVAGVRVDGAVFPLALSAELAEAHPALASFGFVGSYEHVFSFSSSTATASAVGYASRWMVLFVGRIPLGHGARGGHLTLETGFQELTWGSKSPADLAVPNVTYDLVDAGLAWERALGTRKLVLSLRLVFLGLVGAGDLASEAEYGRTSGWGLEAEAGLTVLPTRWLWLRLGARYTPVVLQLAAAGRRYARSATDQWVSGLLEVGFAL